MGAIFLPPVPIKEKKKEQEQRDCHLEFQKYSRPIIVQLVNPLLAAVLCHSKCEESQAQSLKQSNHRAILPHAELYMRRGRK